MKHFLFLFLLFLSCGVSAAPVDTLLRTLDCVLKQKGEYEQHKLERIHELKKRASLMDSNNLRDLTDIYWSLSHEYDAYISDSALFYVNKRLSLARSLSDYSMESSTLIRKAHILSTSGLFVESLNILDSVSSRNLSEPDRIDYYVCIENLYLYQAEYASMPEYINRYLQVTRTYRDSIVALAPKDSYSYVVTHAPQLIDERRYQEAAGLLLAFLPSLSADTREYAVATSILAYAYHLQGDYEQEMEARIHSAIADCKAVVKENYSLQVLAELLYEQGDLERANRYIKLSMEDANVYISRLRRFQAARLLPHIDKAYQMEREYRHTQLQWFAMGIVILSFFLLFAIFFVIKQMKKLASARSNLLQMNNKLQALNLELQALNARGHDINEELEYTNRNLSEANHIKEEYLGRFLDLTSGYITKLEEYKRSLNKLAAAGKLEELYRSLKSDRFIADELKGFYQNFDSSFLKLFPHFVEEFNRLLPDNEQIIPKSGELLVTELRIFALIRLGITESGRIAEFLRCSISTIYTYRSKIRNKSLYKDDFEERVLRIPSF